MFKKCFKSKILTCFLVFCVVSIGVFSLKKIINYDNKNQIIVANFLSSYMNSNNGINYSNHGEMEYIKLYKNNNEYNKKFNVSNMFPGDKEVNYYCVNVSYKDNAKLKYGVSVNSLYENIVDVLNIRVKIIDSDEILYNGTIKNIPSTLDYSLISDESISEDVCYEIEVFLDTSVGNEFQDKEVLVDFKWVVDNENLEEEKNPVTGDNIVFWIFVTIICVISLLIILLTFKKEMKN